MTDLEDKALAAVDSYVRKHNIGSSLRNANSEGQPQGVITDPKQMVGLHASTEIVVKDIAEILTKRFTGFRWAIQPNEIGGVLNIFCLDFSQTWGYVIRYDDVMNDPKRRQAVKAARIILARFRYPGYVYRPELMAQIKRNRNGDAIPDLSDMKPTRFTKKAEIEYALATGSARVVETKEHGQIVEVNK